MARLSLFTLAGFVISSLCFAGAARAALDPELTTPYQLEVVLQIAPHRQMTEIFKDQVERELHDSLQAAFGPLVEVRVVLDHPRLREVEEKGLEQALDAWREVSSVKTHFVFIDFINGQYRVRARQHDGLTGQASPVVREERTSDRLFVARTAALLVDRDFGLVGTVTEKVNDQEVRVAFKGGALDVPLTRWARKGEVLALVQISEVGGEQQATRVDRALLQLKEDPQKGVAVCRLFHHYDNPLGEGSPGLLGCRCLKLATVTAPLRLQLVQRTPRGLVPPSSPFEIHVRQDGFLGETDKIQGSTNPDGFFETKRAYQNVAFVSVLRDGLRYAMIPVALVEDGVIRAPVNIELGTNTPLLIRRNVWIKRLFDSYLVQAGLFKELNERITQPDQREATLARARAGLDNLQRDLSNFSVERTAIQEAASNLPPDNQPDLSRGERVLGELRKTEDKLKKFIESLERIVSEEKDPKRKEAQAKVTQAQGLEEDAEFGKAIPLYEQALADGLDAPQVRAHLESLKNSWRTRGQAHEDAHLFIYETWPKLNLARNSDAVEKAREAFRVCQRAGDTLRPRKLLKVAFEHVTNLEKELDGLKPDINEEDNQAAQVIAKVAEELNQLIKDVAAYLEGAKT